MIRSTLVGFALAALAVTTAEADHTMPVTFQVTVKNVSTTETLKLSNGMTAPAPVSPGVFVVHTGKNPLFTAGKKDMGQGLEWLAEDGNPEMLAKSMEGAKGVSMTGVFNTPVGDEGPGPLLPGKTFTFTFEAVPGQKLSFAEMFGQSNDLFYAPGTDGITLFDKSGKALSGTIQKELVLWDAGTEVNQEPGLGADQGPRQKAPNTGAAENGVIRPVKDGFTYPDVGSVLEVTVTPSRSMAGR